MIQKYIDNTFLQPENIDKLMPKFIDTYKFNFRAICINLPYLQTVIEAKQLFPSSTTKIAIVDNFPMGDGVYNCSYAIEVIPQGKFVDELDIVIPLNVFKQGNIQDIEEWFYRYYKIGKTIKWIIEEPLWSWEEIEKIVENIYKIYSFYKKIHPQIKVPYIKSNTGFRTRTRSLEEVITKFPEIVNRISNGEFRVKISGGIKTYEDAQKIIAVRGIIGTSNGLDILREEHKGEL